MKGSTFLARRRVLQAVQRGQVLDLVHRHLLFRPALLRPADRPVLHHRRGGSWATRRWPCGASTSSPTSSSPSSTRASSRAWGTYATPGLQLGLFGVVGSFISASFLFSSLITTIDQIFRTKYHRSFFYNRLIEFLMMAVVGIFMFFSLAMTAVWTASGRTLQKSELVRATLNPEALAVINNALLIYVIPYLLTFLMFYILYKYIPETKVHTRAGIIPAALRRPALRAVQGGFAFYVAHFSALRHRPEQDPSGDADLGPLLPALDLDVDGHLAVGGGAGGAAEREVRRGRRGQGVEGQDCGYQTGLTGPAGGRSPRSDHQKRDGATRRSASGKISKRARGPSDVLGDALEELGLGFDPERPAGSGVPEATIRSGTERLGGAPSGKIS